MQHEEEEIIKNAFTFFDSNFDDKLTYSEMENSCRALGKLFTDDELKTVVHKIGKNSIFYWL